MGAVCGLHVCKSVQDLDKDTPELCSNEPNLTGLCDRAEIVSAIGAQNSFKRARLNSETGGVGVAESRKIARFGELCNHTFSGPWSRDIWPAGRGVVLRATGCVGSVRESSSVLHIRTRRSAMVPME